MSRSSAPGAKKRPWYLVAALIAAWIFGMTSMNDGCNEISYYKTADHAELVQSQAEAFGRDADQVVQVMERYFTVMDGAKNRVFPLAVGSLLLGAAMWGLAFGAMLARSGARTTLVQVIAVHAALIVVAYTITPDVHAAEAEASSKLAALTPMPRAGPVREARRFIIEHSGVLPVLQRSLRLIGYALVLVALTRRRSREFFEAASAARAEP
jgi:hypothetical protein